jgi:hypothetical protein
MVELLWVALGVAITYAGWVFYSNPQRGFRIYNWPFGPGNGDGLTEEGKPAYRVRGLVIMAMGGLMIVLGLIA